jgi:hypothetical protein
MSCLFFWDVTQHRLVVSYKHFQSISSIIKGQAVWPYLTLEDGLIGCPEVTVTSCQSMLC